MRAPALVLFLVVVFGVPLVSYAGSPASRPKLWSYDWSSKASPNLAQRQFSTKEIERFVIFLDKSMGHEDDLLGDPGGVYVCSFGFADLRHDGVLSLAVGFGVVDRPSCNTVTIIDRTPSGFELYDSGGGNGSAADIPSCFKDLGHDGRLEFVYDHGLNVFPNHCVASWATVFAWTGRNYTNVSHQFKDFYRERLNLLNKLIPALQPARQPDGYGLRDKECLEAEAAAIQRFLGMSADAGIDQAIRLASSSDPLARQFGTVLLIQIGTPEARKYLEKLASDSDYGVSMYAKDGLAYKSDPSKTFGPKAFVPGGSVAAPERLERK